MFKSNKENQKIKKNVEADLGLLQHSRWSAL